ncbi:MAG: hypothetical protein ACYC27_07965 [Armatimonadota bacterium]
MRNSSLRKLLMFFLWVFIPPIMAVIIAKWAFLLPTYPGIIFEWVAYFPAKLPILIFHGMDVSEEFRLISIGAMWLIIAFSIYWRRVRKPVINKILGVNKLEDSRPISGKLRDCFIVSLVIFAIVFLRVIEGLGIIQGFPGLANVSAMTGISFPSRTKLLHSEFTDGFMDCPLNAELEIDRNQIPELLHSLPAKFKAVHQSKPPVEYSRLRDFIDMSQSWNANDGGECIVAEPIDPANSNLARIIIITDNKRSTVSRVYIAFIL